MRKRLRKFLFIIFSAVLCLSFLAVNFVSAQKLTGKYAGKIFYEKDGYPKGQVFMVNASGKKAKNLFSVSDYINGIEAIANNKLGFYTSPAINKSYLYYYDLVTRQKKLVKTVKGYLLQLGWYDKNNYAYLSETQLPDLKFKWALYLTADGKKKKLAQWQDGVYGRGGYYEDDDSLQFSPDGKKIMHIRTGSIRNITDYNIYIFNRKGKITHKIKNATHPVWISNSKIVYRAYESGHLYFYNLKTKKSSKIKGTPIESFNPNYLPEKKTIAFWAKVYDPVVYTYNLKTKRLKKVANNAAYPQWLNSGKILVSRAKHCDPYFEMCPYTIGSGLLNLKTKKVKTLPDQNYFTQYK